MSNFNIIRDKISNDFKQSVEYYLNNKYYKISESTFGKPSEIRFEDCEVYEFNDMVSTIQNILTECIDFNLKSLKRRELNLKTLPKEFAITELQKQIQNNLDSFNTFTQTKRNVYSPDGVAAVFNDTNTGFVEPTYPTKGTFIKNICKGYDQYGVYANGNGGTYEELIQSNSTDCGYTPPPPDDNGGGTGGGGGGGSYRNEYDTLDRQNLGDGMGRERIEQR